MIRKSFLSLVIVIFTISVSFSQVNDSIELPKGGKEVSFYATTNIYATKTQNISTDNKKFNYFDDISNSIMNQFDYSSNPKVVLYADKHTRFEFIQKIKKEIALVNKIFYIMTDSTNNSKMGIPVYLNSFLGIHKNSAEILTLIQVKRNEEFNGNEHQYLPPPKSLSSAWYHEFEEIIYSGNKSKIDSILKKYKYSTIKLKPQKKIIHNKQKVDSILMDKLLERNQIVFLKFDYDLVYDDYVFVINQYDQRKKLNKEMAYLIEIPYELEFLLKNLNIKI